MDDWLGLEELNDAPLEPGKKRVSFVHYFALWLALVAFSLGAMGGRCRAQGAGEDAGHWFCCGPNGLEQDDGSHFWGRCPHEDKIHLNERLRAQSVCCSTIF
jgi:hypothetical protein